MISSAGDSSTNIYVLAFDYRGFGRSTGSPTQAGLIVDATAVIHWANTELNIPSERILLLAQSLGTATVTGTVQQLLETDSSTRFAGIVLCASFTDASTVFLNYSLFGKVPLLAPITLIPAWNQFFSRSIADTWRTANAIESIVNRSADVRLTFVHAIDDQVVPYNASKQLYATAKTAAHGSSSNHAEEFVDEQAEDLGEQAQRQSFKADHTSIRKYILRHGGKMHKVS